MQSPEYEVIPSSIPVESSGAPWTDSTGPEFDRDRIPCRRLGRLIHLPVDGRDLLNKATPVGVLQIQYVRQRPMKVIRDKGYLLEQAVKGVAYDPPASACTPFGSIWKTLLQFGQVTVISAVPLLLMRL